MKLLIRTFGCLLLAGAINACGDSSTTTTTDSDSAAKMTSMDTATKMDNKMDNTHVGNPTDTSVKTTAMAGNDQETVNFLVTGNTKELAWLQAAVNKSSSKDIKDHAAMMIKDHKKLGNDVKDYIGKHSAITMPTPPDVSNEVTINDKKGKEWDNAWLDKMDADHKELLSKLQGAQTSAQDNDLKKLATSAIPVVESHIKMIAMCKKM